MQGLPDFGRSSTFFSPLPSRQRVSVLSPLPSRAVDLLHRHNAFVRLNGSRVSSDLVWSVVFGTVGLGRWRLAGGAKPASGRLLAQNGASSLAVLPNLPGPRPIA